MAKHVGWLKILHLCNKAAREISERRNEIAVTFCRELVEEVETNDA